MENDLRKEAESLLGKEFDAGQLNQKSLGEILHELKVHQIELELQNEELMKTQQLLVSSRQKYFELFDLAPVAYLMIDHETRIHEINLTASDLLKEEKGFLEKKRFDRFVHPDYQDEFYLFFKGLKKESPQTVHESCLLIKDERIYIRIACNIDAPFRDDDQQLVRFTLIDTTIEKLAIKELETVKERLELSLLSGNVAWWVWDYPTQMVYYDKRKAEMLGYEDGNMSQNIYEITSMIHPDDFEVTMQHMREHLTGKSQHYRIEYRLKTRQGIYKWFYDQGSVTQRDAEGKPLKICGVVIDIDEKKKAELQHMESEKRFREFASLLPQVVCELDGDFNIIYLNDYGKKLLGVKNAIHHNLFEFLDRENKELVMNSFQNKINQPGERDQGLQIKIKDSTSNWVTLFIYANLESQQGNITTIRAIGIDLSERIKMEQQLSTLNSELNLQKQQLEDFNKILGEKVSEEVEKNRFKDNLMSLQARQAAMGEMVGHIAHQWKQPLNTLNLIVMDIQDAFTFNELTQDYLNKSVESAKRVIDHMAQTIDDFRNFFKPLKEKTTFNLKDQINTGLSFIRATIELDGIELHNNTSDGLFVTGYPNEFSQVVINIVNNAREALVENTTPDPKIIISSFAEGKKVRIVFENNGGQIPDDILPFVFDPYFSTRDKEKGTGIGLHLVKTIITQNMNGQVGVKNTPTGVEFEIILSLL